MTTRRAFIAGFSGAAVWPLGAQAQQPKRLPVVTLLFTAISASEISGPDPTFLPARAFVHELRDLGWIDGRTIVIERRTLGGDPQRASAVFDDLLARGVDVIALGGARWLHDAGLKATKTIPIVTIFQDDPVAAGLIASLARPGGNLTGVAQTTGPAFFGKRLQLLKEIAPTITRTAFVGPRGVLEQDRGYAHPAGVVVIPVPLDVSEQFDAALTTIRRERADALMVAGSAITYGSIRRIVAFAAEERLPAMHPNREFVEAGGLIAYGTSVAGIFRQLARLADRILKGTRTQDLATEQPTKFELMLNAKTANALGLTIPSTLLAQADEVIE